LLICNYMIILDDIISPHHPSFSYYPMVFPDTGESTLHDRVGRKWRAAEAVQQAEARHKALLGSVAQRRAGLRSSTSTRYDTASGKERRNLVHKEVRASVEEERANRTVAMRQQGA